MQAEPHFSWAREFAIPVFFTVFGAAIGYLATLIRDERRSKRDKIAFLRAIGMELDALRIQLDEWDCDLKDALKSLNDGSLTAPRHFARPQTIVFTSQLGKLRDVSDSLLGDVIQFYSELGALEQSIKRVNDTSDEFARAEKILLLPPPPGTKLAIQDQLLSLLSALKGKVSTTSQKLRKLRAELPQARKTECVRRVRARF